MSSAALTRPAKPLKDEVLDILSNVLFPVVVFLIWAVATVIGTVVDQDQTPERYYEEYAPALANVVLRLHLTNVFHSVPYISLVLLLLLSMGVCTFRRVIPKRFPKDRAVPIENFALHASHSAALGASDALLRLQERLLRRGFRLRTRQIAGDLWVFGDKQKWARYGVLVAHLGFVVISFGIFFGWIKGYKGQLQIFSGQTVAVANTDLLLTLRRFHADFIPVRTTGGIMYQAEKFQSDVAVRGGDNKMASILVNQPYVTPDKVYFYQASYGFAGRLRVRRWGHAVNVPAAQRLMPQDPVYFPGTSRAIEYATMVGPSDPAQVPMGAPLPASDEYALWLFHDNIPTSDKPLLLAVGKSLSIGDGYVVTALAPLAWSGITYRHDPGELWVGAGALILVAGFAMALFFVPVKLYARVVSNAGAAEVSLAATTTKGNIIYEDEFAALTKDLHDALESPPLGRTSGLRAYA